MHEVGASTGWGRARVVSEFLSFLLVTLMIVLLTPAPVLAEDCPGEVGIFLNKPRRNAYGTAGDIYLYNHKLDSCSQNFAVQTQLIVFTSDARNWVEIGYRKQYRWWTGTVKKLFGEWGYYPYGGLKFYGNMTDGTAPRFRVLQKSGTFDWKISVKYPAADSFTHVDTYTNMYDNHGWALGGGRKAGRCDKRLEPSVAFDVVGCRSLPSQVGIDQVLVR